MQSVYILAVSIEYSDPQVSSELRNEDRHYKQLQQQIMVTNLMVVYKAVDQNMFLTTSGLTCKNYYH